MEVSRIIILEKLSLITVVMPYYSYTHRIFLVLSMLSKKSRFILKSNYGAFRKAMLKYTLEKNSKIKDLANLYLPLDLFKFRIGYSISNWDDLIIFLNTVIVNLK